MNKIPERIFIQQFEDPKIEGFQNGEDVTWCDHQIHSHDVEYINADKFNELVKKTSELKESIMKISECMKEPDKDIEKIFEENYWDLF